MNCLQLADKLASKRKSVSSPFFPYPKGSPNRKSLVAHLEAFDDDSLETEPINPFPNIKEKSYDCKCHSYVPSFQRVFDDKNLFYYFKKYIENRNLGIILQLYCSVTKYKEQFYSQFERRSGLHQKIIQYIHRLPQEYQIPSSFKIPIKFKPSSFDECIVYVLQALYDKEFEGFINSKFFVKWVLKYHNTEIY